MTILHRLGKVLALLAWTGSSYAETEGPVCDSSEASVLVQSVIINGNGRINGSLQQTKPESITLNGSSVITGDLRVPGTPQIILNGQNHYQGTIVGSGNAAPNNYQVRLNGQVTLRHVVTRVNPVPLPAVAPIPSPTGTRNVVIEPSKPAPGSFATLRNLIVNGAMPAVPIPPGTYGEFTANGDNSFILGVEGATGITVYNFQRLTVNGRGRIEVRSPVILNIANSFIANGEVGSSANPGWLRLNVAQGGITLNGSSRLHGRAIAPQGEITLNGNSSWSGSLATRKLILNSGCVINAHSVNTAPVALPESVITPFGTPVTLQLKGTDAESDFLTFGMFTPPAHGTLTAFNELTGTVTYTPANGYHGADSFAFVAYDESCRSAPATIALTVQPPATPPIARPDAFVMPQGERLRVSAPGVLANDTSPTETALSAALKTAPLSGLVTLDPDGGFTYEPAPGFVGDDVFSYTLKDAGGEAVTTVSIRVTPANRPPVADSKHLFTTQDTSVPVVLSGSDPEGGAITFLIQTAPQQGVLTGVAPDVRYIPNAGFNGTDTFTYSVRDPQGLQATGTITITVGRTNLPPIGSFTYSTPQVQAAFEVTLDASGSTDRDGHVVTYAWDFDGDGVIDATGSQATHRFDTGGIKTVLLIVTDNDGATGHARQPLALNLAPEVSLRGSSIHYVDTSVRVTVEASDTDGVVETVELYLGDALVGSLARGQTDFSLGALAPGFYQIKARAIDDAGAFTDSEWLHFAVRARRGDFVITPLQRSALLPAVLGSVGPDGGWVEATPATTTQPLFAANDFSAPVDYTLTLIDNRGVSDVGYVVQDSRFDPELEHEWTSIATSGNRLEEVSNADDTWEEVALPFPFTFYGVSYETLFVSSNGVVTFREGTATYDSVNLPTDVVDMPLIAPFWTDLTTVNESGDGGGYNGNASLDRGAIYYKALEDRVIIEFGREIDDPYSYGISNWDGWARYNFQIVLFRNGDIIFRYGYLDGYDYPTVGIQQGPDQGIDRSFTPFLDGGDFSLRFLAQQGAAPWFTVDRLTGSLAPGENEQLTITYHSRPDYVPGVYEGAIRVDHTQPGLDPYLVSVRLEIIDQYPAVAFTSPDPARVTYLFAGAVVPIRIQAEDADGWIRHVDVSVDNTRLVRLSQSPYTYQWRDAPVGDYVLSATATDNDGNTMEAEAALVSISVDSDGDGLPDAWELDHIGNLSQGGLDDADGDGRSNLKEFYLGSSPWNEDPAAENLSPTAHVAVTRLSGEAPFAVAFNGAGSRDPDGRVVAWQWDFDGDGVFDATGPQVTRVFTEAGTVPVLLQVTDDEGSTGTRRVNVTVKAAGTAKPPRAAFDAAPYINEAALSVTFNASASTDEDGDIESYHWDFGDNSTGEGAQADHLYTRVGVYAVTLTVTDNDGLSSFITKHVTATHHQQSPFEESNGFLVMEGEHYTGLDRRADTVEWAPGFGNHTGRANSGEHAALQPPTLSRNGQVQLPLAPLDDIGPDHSAEVSWLVRITTPGIYYYAVRATNPAEGNTAATIHVGVDGRTTSPPAGDWIGISAWPVWRQGASLGHLDAGLHRIHVRRGTHTIGIDQLAISLVKSALPAAGDLVTVLPSQTRPDLRLPPPTAVIAGDRFQAAPADSLSFHASDSFTEAGTLSAWTWRLHTTDPAGRPSSRLLSTENTVTFSVDDFDRAFRKGHANSALGDYELELTVQDSLGGLGSTRRTLVVSDPIAEAEAPDAIIIDNRDPGFSSAGAWRTGRGLNDWINGIHYAGGLAEYRRQLPGPVPTLAFVTMRTVQAENFVGEDFLFAEPASSGVELMARFTPSVSEAGRYLVFARVPQLRLPAVWPDTEYPLPSIPVAIRSNEGDTSLRFDQAVGGGRWRLLTVRDFAAGTTGHVEFTAPAQRGFALVDAVKLVKATAIDAPVASFTWESRSAQSVRFDATASPAVQGGAGTLSYLWEFGDGHLSRAANPLHRYEAPGSYTVRLTVIDSRLAVATVEQIVTVAAAPGSGERPVARLQLDQQRGRIPFTVTFDGSLSSDDSGIVGYETKAGLLGAFGSTGSFTFGQPGRHAITLTVTDEAGLTDAVTLVVEALPAGYAEGTEVIITANSAGSLQPEGAWATVPAPFGQTLRTEDVSATLTLRPYLPHAGLYQVFLLLPERGSGSSANAFASVPSTELTLSHAGMRSHVEFNATRDPEQWHPIGTFMSGNGAQDSLMLANTSGEGSLAFRAAKWVALDEGLTAKLSATLSSTVAPATANLTASVSPFDAPAIRHEWDFGDGTIGEGETASHLYQTPGTYTVVLRVTDGRGAVAIARQTLRIASPNSPPSASFVATQESPLLWSFDSSASGDEDGIVAHLWDLGDGHTQAGEQIRHRYTSPGNYTVTLRVVDARDAASIASRLITVTGPTAAPTSPPFGAAPQPSSPLDYIFSAPPAESYAWDFGDGTTSSESNPAHRYAGPGTYRVVLRLTQAGGGVREQVRWITVGAEAGAPPSDDSTDDPSARPTLYTPLAQP